jgi:hypothetical protein
MRSFIERLGNIPKSLLSGRIPNIQGNQKIINLDSLHLKIYSNSAQIIGLKRILAIPDQQTSLSDSTIPNDQIFQCNILLNTHYYNMLIKFQNIIYKNYSINKH